MVTAITRGWRSQINYPLAALTTLAAGAIMMLAGHAAAGGGRASVGLLPIVAGPLISGAFALARRARGQRFIHRTAQGRAALLLMLVLPSPGGGLSLLRTLAVSIVTVAAGAAMTLAGYVASTANPLLALPEIAAAGVIITLAFALDAMAQSPVAPRRRAGS